MRSPLFLMLATISLTSTPLSAQGSGAGDVDVSEAMACSALYTVLASAVDGDPEYDELVRHASQWLVVASLRAGREHTIPEEDLLEWVGDLLNEMESQKDEQASEAFLLEGIDLCEARYELIADEFDSIDID